MRILLLAALVACSDPPAVGPDAMDDGFGNACTWDMSSPLMSCKSATGRVGWCIVSSGSDGVCRRACHAAVCPTGQQATPVYNDCYCMP